MRYDDIQYRIIVCVPVDISCFFYFSKHLRFDNCIVPIIVLRIVSSILEIYYIWMFNLSTPSCWVEQNVSTDHFS